MNNKGQHGLFGVVTVSNLDQKIEQCRSPSPGVCPLVKLAISQGLGELGATVVSSHSQGETPDRLAP